MGLGLYMGLANTHPQTWRRLKQDDKFEDANSSDLET